MKTNVVRNSGIMIMLVLLTSLTIEAQPYYGRGKMGNPNGRGEGFRQGPYCPRGNISERMGDYLDLSEEQSEKIQSFWNEHSKEVLPVRNELRIKRAELKSFTTQDLPSMTDIEKKIDEIGALQTKLMKLKAKHVQDVRKVLTEDQRARFDMHSPRGNRPGGCWR